MDNKKFLDYNGLLYFYSLLNSKFLKTETDPTVPSWAKQPTKPSYNFDEITDGTTNKAYTDTEKTKLASIIAGVNRFEVGSSSGDNSYIGFNDGGDSGILIRSDSEGLRLETAANGNVTVTPGGTGKLLYNNNEVLTTSNLNSPALTGTPTAPTATAGTNTTLIATTAFVKTAIDSKTVIHLIPSIAQMTADTTVMSGCTVYIESDPTLAANIIADVAAGKEVILEDADGGLYRLSINWAGSGLCLFVLSNSDAGNSGAELSVISVFIISSTSASYTSYNICALQAETYDKLTLDTLLALKAPLASPALTGTPTAPTATAGTNSTQIATTAFVSTAVTNAMAGVTSISYSVLGANEDLPVTGTAGVIYLKPKTGDTGDGYDEYIYVNNTYELIGHKVLDLSTYWDETHLVAITNEEIVDVVYPVTPSAGLSNTTTIANEMDEYLVNWNAKNGENVQRTATPSTSDNGATYTALTNSTYTVVSLNKQYKRVLKYNSSTGNVTMQSVEVDNSSML